MRQPRQRLQTMMAAMMNIAKATRHTPVVELGESLLTSERSCRTSRCRPFVARVSTTVETFHLGPGPTKK